jgi:hypothetical protein
VGIGAKSFRQWLIVGAAIAIVGIAATVAVTTRPTAFGPSRRDGPPSPILRRSNPYPLFAGTNLPVPPQQSAPWTPPRHGVSPKLISATQALFAEGLPDPRGCEYREVAFRDPFIASGMSFAEAEKMTFARHEHAWLLPAERNATVRFAICRDGLIRPVEFIGAPADLGADTRTEVRDAREYREKLAKQHPAQRPQRLELPDDTPIEMSLLLRLGQTDLAEGLRTELLASGTIDEVVADPYLEIASRWAENVFSEAVWTHLSGDDNLALATAREARRIQPLIEAEAARRGFKKGHPLSSSGVYLDFLEPLPELLADQERRAREGRHGSLTDDAMKALPGKSDRIHALIGDFDMVTVQMIATPGGSYWASDPIVVALIAEGDEAVEPVLDAYVNDDRLIRSALVPRFSGQHYSMQTVSDAAFYVLTGILHTSEDGSEFRIPPEYLWDKARLTRKHRLAVAKAIRAYWQTHRNASGHS